MALETIQQVLAPNNAPYINGVAARLKFSKAFLQNLYQGLVEKDGKGVDDNWVSATDAEENAQIIVHRVRPVEMMPREIGSNKNGGAYSQNQHYSQTESVAIEILQVIDDPIKIPRVTQDMIPVSLLAEHTKIYSDRLATILNGATTASKILATYLAKAAGNEVHETVISASDISNSKILNKFIVANGYLDEGDYAHGVDIFPRDTRVAIVRTSFGPILKTDGVLKLGGANEAYAILKAAGITNDGQRIQDDGYIGTIDGVEVRVLSNESMKHASRYLGFPDNELKDGPVYGYIASSYANARGVSTAEQTKVVDEVDGQGIRLLPYCKFGCACWYPLGNSFLLSEEYDPFGALKTLFSAVASNITFKLKSFGSRLLPKFASAGITFSDSTHFTLAGTHAYDDFSTEHLLSGYFVVTTAPVKTVAEFIKEATADSADAGVYDILTGGSQATTAAMTGKYLNVLAISDDGTCAIISKAYSA